MKALATLLLGALLPFACASTPDHPMVRQAPEPEPAFGRPEIPGTDLVWVPDRVELREGAHVWVPGHWRRVRGMQPAWRGAPRDKDVGDLFVLFVRKF